MLLSSQSSDESSSHTAPSPKPEIISKSVTEGVHYKLEPDEEDVNVDVVSNGSPSPSRAAAAADHPAKSALVRLELFCVNFIGSVIS